MTAPSWTGLPVLVTGATGFLGSHVAARLVREGARVHALVRETSPRERIAQAASRIECWTADVRDASAVARCVDRVQPRVVFHFAATTVSRASQGSAGDADWERQSYATNVLGTLNVVAALDRIDPSPRLVRTGGIEEYGAGTVPYAEDQREAPLSTYGASQVAATHLLDAFHRRVGLDVVTLRPALIYGPAQAPSHFIPGLIQACVSGTPFNMTAGLQTRDFVYVDDVVEAVLLAASLPGLAGHRFNIGSGEERRIRDLAEQIVTACGSASTLRRGALSESRVGPPRMVLDTRLAAQRLGWIARTPLETGLRNTIAWYRSRRHAPSRSPAPP